MPQIKGIPGPYRVLFASFDCNDPAHAHVERDEATCKFRLEPVELAHNHNFSAHEVNAIRRLLAAHCSPILEAWHEHCGG